MSFETTDLYLAMQNAKYRTAEEKLKEIVKQSKNLEDAIKKSLIVVCETLKVEKGKLWVYEKYSSGLIKSLTLYGMKESEKSSVVYGEGVVGETVRSGLAKIVNNQSVEISKRKYKYFNGLYIPLNYKGETFGCFEIIDKLDDSEFNDKDLELANSLSYIFTNSIIENNVQFDFIGKKEKREQLLKGLSLDEKEIVALFININSYSLLIGRAGPKKTAIIMNTIYMLLSNIVEANGGFVDKFMGNEALVLYNSPKKIKNPIENAIKTAIQIKKEKFDILKKVKDEYNVELSFSFGISYGNACVGTLGNNNGYYFYTAIGDCVNIANKLSRIAKNGEILVEKTIAKEIRNKAVVIKTNKAFKYRELEEIEMFRVDSLDSTNKLR